MPRHNGQELREMDSNPLIVHIERGGIDACSRRSPCAKAFAVEVHAAVTRAFAEHPIEPVER